MSGYNLGKLQSTHEISPVFLQRAVFVAALSFVCFMAMLFGFYIRQNIGYFLLSTAFLMVYILTMFGWLTMRKNTLKVYENGIVYKKFTARWNEIKSLGVLDKKSFEIVKINGEKVVLSEAIQDVESVISRVRNEMKKSEPEA